MGVIKHNDLLIRILLSSDSMASLNAQKQECSDCTNRVIQHSKQYTVPALIFTAVILQESVIWQKHNYIDKIYSRKFLKL